MAKVEIETLTPNCVEYCEHVDISQRPGGALYCSKLWMCKAGAHALYNEVLVRYEDEKLKALNKSAGLKEPAVWNRAIEIMEEYIEC